MFHQNMRQVNKIKISVWNSKKNRLNLFTKTKRKLNNMCIVAVKK